MLLVFLYFIELGLIGVMPLVLLLLKGATFIGGVGGEGLGLVLMRIGNLVEVWLSGVVSCFCY